jgi:hypothetical protein
MNADPHQSHQQNEYVNGQWGNVGGYSTGWVSYNTTPMHEHRGYDFGTPTMTDVACVSIMRAILALSRQRLVVRLQNSILYQFSS